MLPLNNLHFKPTKDHHNKTISLTAEKIRVIEKSSVFSPAEKVHLLCLHVGQQFITDIGLHSNNITLHEKELIKLDIPFSRQEDASSDWLLASNSQFLLDDLEMRKNILSEVEAGVLYGYPVTAALAFSGAIDKRLQPPKTPAEFFLAGVYSRDFYENEINYYQTAWQNLIKISPKIVDEAENFYKSKL